MESKNPSAPGPDFQSSGEREFERYRLIRDEIIHEDNLISNRLNWFTASQSFLLTALSIANKGDSLIPTPATDFLFPLVPIIAIFSCMLIWIGILAGIGALRRWRFKVAKFTSDRDDLPNILPDEPIIVFGWSAPVLLPVVFLFSWTYLLFEGYR